MAYEVEDRLSTVEVALAQFIMQTNRSLNSLHREMKEFKDEMKEFKDEMKEFKDEMKEFKDEMLDYKEESRQDRKNMNKQWGDLANKMGTLVEDIVAPAVRPAIKRYFGEEVEDMMIHRQKFDKGAYVKGEFDVIAVSKKAVYLVETKSSPNKEKLLEFKNQQADLFRKLHPEYDKLELVLVFASLSFNKNLIDLATKEKIFMLAYREWEYMDILNFEAIKG